MASPVKFSLFLLFACSLLLLLQGTQGEKYRPEGDCETIPNDSNCIFSINTQGNWCVLAEDHDAPDGRKCVDSEFPSEQQESIYEDEGCLDACGVDRNMIGLPTLDSIKKYPFIQQLCSLECSSCRNVFDAYTAIAKKGGIDLQELCSKGQEAEEQAKETTTEHRSMAEVESKSPAPAPGGARPVSEMASSLWEAATGLFESAKSPSASKAVDSAVKAVASSPSIGDAIDSAFNAAAPSPSPGASAPSGGNAAAGYEDDYSA